MMSSANALTEFISLGGTDLFYGLRMQLENLDVKFHQTFVMATLEEANALLEAERQKLQTAGGTLSRIV